MRFNINVNQSKCVEWGLNGNQGALFDLLNQAVTWAKPQVIGGEVYYWVSRNKIIEEIPLYYSKADTAYRALKDLAKKGLIEYKKEGQKDLIRLTEKGKTWNAKITGKDTENNSEINPNDEKICQKLGNKSEETRKYIRKNSEIYPTYKNTNNKNYKNNKKNKQKKENSKTFKPEKPDEVSEQVWNDLLDFRKKRNLSDSKTAWSRILNQLEGAKLITGHELDEIIGTWLDKGWTSFKSLYYTNLIDREQRTTGNRHANNQPANRKPSATDHFARERAKLEAKYGKRESTMRTVS